MDKLKFHSIDSGYCRIYYTQGNSILCYMTSIGSDFELYECSQSGEPSCSISHDDYLSKTPLPTGVSSIENDFRKWIVKMATSSESKQVSEYLVSHGGMPTEFDISINDLSRSLIYKIKSVFGECFVVKINLYSEDRGNRDSIAKKVDKTKEGFPYNFCGAIATPIISDEVLDMILHRDQQPYESAAKDAKLIDAITEKLESLGGKHLIWA